MRITMVERIGLAAALSFAFIACGGSTSGPIDEPSPPAKSGSSASTPAPAPSATTTSSGEPSSNDPPPAPPTPSAAETYFETHVYPSLEPTCGSAACHGGRGEEAFFTPSAADTYAIFKTQGFAASRSSSPIVEKGVHEGPALESTQTAVVMQWLALENP